MAKQFKYAEDRAKPWKRAWIRLPIRLSLPSVPKAAMWFGEKFGAPSSPMTALPIAKEIELEDPFENMGAQLIKEVSTKTNDVAETAPPQPPCFAQAIIKEGLLKKCDRRRQSHGFEAGHSQGYRAWWKSLSP